VPGKADAIDRRYHGSFVPLAEIQSLVALLDAAAAGWHRIWTASTNAQIETITSWGLLDLLVAAAVRRD